MNSDYSKYLKSQEWKKKREEVLERDGYKCQKCEATENLQVHHLTYKNIFNEPLEDLQTLCADCHRKVHEIWDKRKFKKRKINKGNNTKRKKVKKKNKKSSEWKRYSKFLSKFRGGRHKSK